MAFSFDLPTIWAFIISFAIFAYVVMDGFDLGIGLLFPSLAVGDERDQAMNSIAPVWDGNESWLVLGGGGYYALQDKPKAPSVALQDMKVEDLEKVLEARRKADAEAAEKRRLEEEAQKKANTDAEAKQRADAELT